MQNSDDTVTTNKLSDRWIKGLVSKETAVLCRWRVEINLWFINRVDK